MKKILCAFLLTSLLSSCHSSGMDEVKSSVKDWIGKEIDPTLACDIMLKDIKYDHTIISYVDTLGCISCKLQLNNWKKFESVLDSLANVRIIFIVHPSVKKEMGYLFESYCYSPDVCYEDSGNRFKRTIPLFQKSEFQTLLLDKNNKIVAIGNPVHNPKVKELYLKIIQGDKIGRGDENGMVKTKVSMEKTSVPLGSFDWQEEQKATFTLKNVGDNPLVIEGISTSCGCTAVEYPKEPVRPGNSISLQVTYIADHPGHFNKTITVYCNAEASPVQLKISGDAE